MQSVIQDDRLQEVRRRLLEENKATLKRIHPVHANTFNNSMKNKIDHANQMLKLMDLYPNMTVKDLLYLIECRIEGENSLSITIAGVYIIHNNSSSKA